MKNRMLLFAAVMLLLLQWGRAQQGFTVEPVPNPFTLGDRYPDREEEEVCRAIRDYIDRNSVRFTTELVTNVNSQIDFGTSDARIMTSRMQTRVNRLATLYGQRFTVLKAWTEFPDSDLTSEPRSLHYEGRTIRVSVNGLSNAQISDFLTTAVQAAFDWVVWEHQNYVRLSVIPDSCEVSVDFCWMLDQSGSVGEANHNIAKEFIKNVVSFFTIGLDATRVGLVAYSTESHVEFDLDRRTTLEALQQAIDNVGYRGGWTATALALDDARELLDPDRNNGARPDSQGIPKVAVLITDGKSNQHPIDLAAPALRDSGVQVYAVGIGNIDIDELRFIASDPDDEHVFILNSFNDAAGFVNLLSLTACETPAIINPCVNTVTEVSGGFIRYFQAECTTFSDTVVVELIDTAGTNYLYCSTVETNPGPLTDSTTGDETMGVSTRTCTVDLSGSEEVIYIGVQGQENMNSFNLVVWDTFFENDQVSTTVIEGTALSSLVSDVSEQETSAASGLMLEYSIEDGNDGTFAINSQNGRITLQQDVSFDDTQSYSLLVNARNMNSDCCHRARITVNVQVIRNRIDFPDSPPVDVSENAPIGDEVTQFQASGGAGSLEFSITGGNPDGAFAIDPSTGTIEVASSLNFETVSIYDLTIHVSSVGTSVEGDAVQRILVMDENERPFFTTPCALDNSCAFEVTENVAADTAIGSRIEADDLDLDSVSNGMLAYTISDLSLPFRVNQNGRLRTTASIDREETDSYSVNVIVKDMGIPSLSVQTTVLITVLDENDVTPFFVQGPTSPEVEENSQNGHVLAQYIAEDDDLGNNAVIEYSLTPQNVPFDLDPQNGVLTVSGAIDYEDVQEYMVTVTASNPDGLSASVDVNITVIDLNDNSPVFSPNLYTDEVLEHSSIGTPVSTVSATDADSGSNGEIRYSITAGNAQNSFAINDTSGEVTVNGDIDRETITSFSLTVRARDLGSPQQSGFATVNVEINDKNDNPPDFDPDSYSASLREDTQVGFDILTVIANDPDEPGNPNSQIQYSISSGNTGSTFTLDSTTGLLELANSLDFENQESYTLEVLAEDQGDPTMSDTATVTIEVVNVNESPPVLNNSQTEYISELAPVPLDVTQFNAQDLDSGETITYSIVAGNSEMKFTIDESSGLITLVSSLDFETTPKYELKISASDGTNSDTANLTVNVIDENEFPPEFFGTIDFQIDEEMPAGTLVGTVQATDADGSPNNSIISFSFVPSVISNYIDINPDDGSITTLDVLDREQLTQIFPASSGSSRSVGVTARDNGAPSMQSTTTITITLRDINDNPPIFTDSLYQNTIFENLPSQVSVFQVSASDIDLGSNAEIMFSFEVTNLPTPPFEINSTTGLVRTTESLDREQQEIYDFIITATDRGDPAMSSTAQGTLTVLDENDNDPIFTMPVYEITLAESKPLGPLNLDIHADDPDKDLNGEVRYLLIGQGDPGFVVENDFAEETIFDIDSMTGVIEHLTPFNYELQTDFNLTVVAHDLGTPRRSSSAEVIIHVTNVDESPPFFLEVNCHAEIPEDHPVNTVVRSCIAEDPDNITTSPDQVGIFYSIFGETDTFEIGETTGEITLIQQLDYDESERSYELQIFATDLTMQFSIIQNALITVTDVNDNSPRFINAPYDYTMSRERLRNYVREISVVQAEDIDSTANGNGRIVFSIESITRGETETILEIMATDEGSSPRSASTTLTITYEFHCLLQNYDIDSSTGVVAVDALCSIGVTPLEENVVLDGDHSFTCNTVRNGPTTFQWIHNGSTITASAILLPSLQQTTLTISEARFEDAGGYACKVTTPAGSLQSSPESIVHIQVPPRITVPPQDAAVSVGESVEFSCSAVGIPHPTIQWLFNNSVIGTEAVLSVQEVEEEDEGSYTCVASSSAGEAEASATLTLFVNTDVVEVTLGGVNNPNEDGSCHYFDVDEFQELLTQLTGQTTMVTGVSSDAVCDQSACSPNPCMNGGSCELNQEVDGGYECFCRNGFTGTDCEIDIDECRPENPCGTGSCFNVMGGSYYCECPSGRSGGRCQYINSCSNGTHCNASQDCINSLSSLDGYVCQDRIIDLSEYLIVTVADATSAQRLEDFILAFIEAQQQAATGKRRKRQISVDDPLVVCEPILVPLDNNQLALIWNCPDGVDPPSDDTLAELCSFLATSGSVESCQPPNREVVEQPTPPTLDDTTITIEFVQVDPETDEPVDAGEVLDTLDETDAVADAAGQLGSSVEEEPQVSVPVNCTNGDPDGRGRCNCYSGWTGISCNQAEATGGGGSGSTDNTPIIIGAVIAALVIAAIVVVVVIVAIVVGKKMHEQHNTKQEEKRRYAQELSVLENQGYTTTPTPPHVVAKTSSVDPLVNDDDALDYDELSPQAPARPPKPSPQPRADPEETDYENIWRNGSTGGK